MISRRTLFITAITALLCVGVSDAFAVIRTISSGGKNYVAFNTIAAYYGMETTTPQKDRIRLRNQWHTLEFETAGRRCWINGTLLWLHTPVKKIGWQYVVDEADFNKAVDPSLRPYEFLSGIGTRTVVLDAGHGGRDNGAVSPRNVQEKLLTLAVTKRVRDILQARGINVILTRTDDRFLTLTERTKIAASISGDLFVSIHANSAEDRSANGIETYVLALPGFYSSNSFGSGTPSTTKSTGNRFDAANGALGFRIQQNLVRITGRNDRGVKRARFDVLKNAPCPAALVEIAFLSNAREESVVLEADGRDKIARGIADGILAYLSDAAKAKKK